MHPRPLTEYLNRVGAEILNWRRAMVRSYRGDYYKEKAVIKINLDGTVTCSVKEYAPTAEEAASIAEAVKGLEFPRSVNVKNIEGLREKVKKDSILYEFYDRPTGEIIMVQERQANPKRYVPWVFLSSGEWAAMEPDGPLPFFKPKVGRAANGARIMIHEGAKAAAAAQQIVEGNPSHPWWEELSAYEHWGMIGGALAPHRSDYHSLRSLKPREVVYVCDNDRPGVSALQRVSQTYGDPLKGVIFGDTFPPSWDMADELPKELFTSSGRWKGKPLRSFTYPATWATMQQGGDKAGRPTTVIRPEFAEEWLHCIKPEAFIHKDWPDRIWTGQEFNSKIAPFSHVDDTARLLRKDLSSKAAVLQYDPGLAPGIYNGGPEGLFINTCSASGVRPERGDPGPWLRFMEHLVPDEYDRQEVYRWCATLVAKPSVKMLYGMLMISEMQGVGKGTLGEKILTPLVGVSNVSTPSEQEIVESQYNYWVAHRRLAVVHEIYAGQSSKAYNKLKSCITDRYVTVQKKYQAHYTVENWIHIFACSNSMRAIKLSMDDRRWFVPRLTEEKKPPEYWESFNRWLAEGGLEIIAWWAGEWLAEHGAVEPGAEAPATKLKRQIVEEGYSPGQQLVARTLEGLQRAVEAGELSPDVFTLDTELVALIRNEIYEGRHNERLERPATVRAVAKTLGWHAGDERAWVKAWGPNADGGRLVALSKEVAKAPPSSLCNESMPTDQRRHPIKLGNSQPL